MATVSGTVKDKDGNFAARMVRAYRRSDGAFAGQTISNATTGAYSITALDGTAHFAVVHDGVVTAGDPYWNNVVLGMHMDDVGLTDAKGHAITLIGNVARSSAQSKFGGYSAYFDGAGDYLYPVNSGADFALGTGDFTIELQANFSVLNTGKFFYDGRPNSANGYYPTIYVNASNKVALLVNASVRITSATSITTNTWYHIALCRSSGVTRLFVNGVQEGSAYTDTNSYLGTSNRPIIGIDSYNLTATPMHGYIDDLRITKGVARYTASFTPPTSAFLHGPSLGSPTENALVLDNITPL